MACPGLHSVRGGVGVSTWEGTSTSVRLWLIYRLLWFICWCQRGREGGAGTRLDEGSLREAGFMSCPLLLSPQQQTLSACAVNALRTAPAGKAIKAAQ